MSINGSVTHQQPGMRNAGRYQMKTNNCEKVKTMSIILIVCAALVATLFIDAAPAKCRHSELISKFQSPQWSEGKFRNELNTYS